MMYQKNYLKCFYSFLAVGAAILFFAVQPSLAAYLVAPSAYWKLDDSDPSSGVADEFGVNNGTCTNCPGTTTGQIGAAFDFLTDNEAFVEFDDSVVNGVFDFAAGGNFTIELWMKRVDGDTIGYTDNSNEVMIGRYDASGTLWWVGVNNSGKLAVYFKDSSATSANQIDGSTIIADDAWHHIAVVRDGTADTLILYVDGTVEHVENQGGDDVSTDGSFETNESVQIGRFATAFFFNGALDNVAVYSSTALSSAQVSQNYRTGLTNHNLEEEFAPVFNDASKTTTIGVGFTATLEARATGNPLPTYASSDLPTGATIDGATGDITWLPTDQQTGANSFTVSASNSQGASSSNQSWTATVSDLCTSDIDGYWKLDEADPSAGANDEIGSLNGTCSTSCPGSIAGRVGTAFDFSLATDDVITFADVTDNPFDFAMTPAGFTIELWMKLASAPGGTLPDVLIGRSGGGNTIWWIGLQPDGGVSALFLDSGSSLTTKTQLDGSTNVADDNWHHIAVVRDGAGETLTLYVDGVLEASHDTTEDGDFNEDFSSTAAVQLGQFGGNNNFDYAGAIDEVSISAVALSSDIIKQHATAASDQTLCSNQAPTITSTADATTATEGVAYSYTATATDPEGHDITWSLTTNPAGMTIDATTGVVSWTPDSSASTTEDVAILATDKYGATASQSYTIDVTLTGPGNSAPDITSTAPTTATVGTAYTYDAEATDADTGDTLTWSLAAGAPADMTVDASTGVVSWTPPEGSEGDVNYTLMVSDGAATDSQPVTVTVSAAINPDAPDDTDGDSGGGGGGGGCFISAFEF